MQYIDGDKSAATEKLKLAASANSPEKLEECAVAARALSAIPGASAYSKPMSDALDILVVGAEAKSSEQIAVTTAAREAAAANVQRALTTSTEEPAFDPATSRTETVNPALATVTTFCDAWKVETHSAGGCPDELFIVAGSRDAPAWSLSTTTAFGIHGARYVVGEGQPMFVAARSAAGVTTLKKPSACSVTWSCYTSRRTAKW